MSGVATGVRGDESALVARLTLAQKVRLLTGADSWALHGESSVGLRPIVLSDGPAGVRGTHFDQNNPSTLLPCPVALAATWDEDLVQRIASELGREARAKGVDVLLGPTVNIVRTPLNGRGFECFSEDPLLSARIAVAYVRGVQSAGVAATAKHYVANDSETERRTYDARIEESVLRELYLPPFEACVAEAHVLLIMAAYNSVNGATMTANSRLLSEILKEEWGFDGVVVSDWSATTSTVPSALGGLDLVMPGPRGPWGDQLTTAVQSGEVPESVVDDKVARLLTVARQVGGLNGTAAALESAAPRTTPHGIVDPVLLREITARSLVLLANPRGLLPLQPGKVRKLALIGPNALDPVTQGGGSIMVLPAVRPQLAASLRNTLGSSASVTVQQGCVTSLTVGPAADGTLVDPVSGEPGVRLEVQDLEGVTVYDKHFRGGVVTWWDGLPDVVHAPGSRVVMRARYTPQANGPHIVGAAGLGHLRISVDGSTVAEGATELHHDIVEALSRPPELRAPIELHDGRKVEIQIEFRPELRFVALRLGIARQTRDDRLIEDATLAAAEADVAVVVVGSADGTESEGYDRASLQLPGRQDELVTRVAAANANTIVVVNSGMPVLMPWSDQVAAIIQAWLPGQAIGDALADTLLGVMEPGGRLPVSLPRHKADSPVLDARPEAGELVYAEGLLVGYRGFDRAGSEPLYAFGHGLGYTDWSYESLVPAQPRIAGGDDLDVTVVVRNTGTRTGNEIVQLYLEPPDDDPSRPIRVLAAFSPVTAAAGEVVAARLTVPARAFMRYDVDLHAWVSQRATYALRAGRSSRDLRLSAKVVLG
jgi:beta-glucosidase